MISRTLMEENRFLAAHTFVVLGIRHRSGVAFRFTVTASLAMTQKDRTMSTPEEEFLGSRSNHPKYVSRYTSHEDGDQFAEGVARRKFRAIVDDRDPKVEVDYDRSRHVIKITQEGGETAEFDDRPARFLLMECDPGTKKVKPVLEWGDPVYYYLAREVEGESPGMESANTE